jgi:hypothetical protein
VLWLRADNGSASAATDLTGRGHNAAQSDPTKRPTYEAAGFLGQPSWLFDGSNDHFVIADHADLDVGTGAWLVVAAGEFLRDTDYEFWLGKCKNATGDNIRLLRTSTDSGRLVGYWGNDTQQYASGNIDVQVKDTQTVFGWGLDGVNEIIIYDAAEHRPRTITVSGTGSNSEDLRIGCDTNGALPCNFRLAELVMLKHATTIPTADVQRLLNYLKSYWGI